MSGAAVSLWWLHQDANTTESAEDCAVVEGLAREWAEVEKAAQRGDTPVGWSVMSDKATAAAESVSAPTIKGYLMAWADGFNLLAQIQSDEADAPIQGGLSSDEFERIRAAGDLIYVTADDLHDACPNAWVPQHQSN
ncbi:hypothetical protein [Mycolicibacterium thermoresistibile]